MNQSPHRSPIQSGRYHRVPGASCKTAVDKLTQTILAKAFRGELVPTEAELARREGREYEAAVR